MMMSAGMMVPFAAYASEPVAPGNLEASVNGMVVNLSWDWGNATEKILSQDFEGDQFPASGWSVKNTYSYDDGGNWMIYDFSDDPENSLAHSGFKTAMVMMGADDENAGSTVHQDEWLIVRPGAGASYMDFWYFLHPELKEVGSIREFPDHYYVKISFDNGNSWEELWDGRWDRGQCEGVQQASLFLGEETDDDTLVAFQAVSGEESSLYFLWCVDDVEFYSAEEMKTRSLNARVAPKKDLSGMMAGLPLHREFKASPGAARLPQEEWLNNGNTTYRIYLDGELIADYLKTRSFIDYSNKTPGKHTYSVMAWSESDDLEYDAAEVDVEIGEVSFPAPRNLTAYYELQDDGKYMIQAEWEAPEGEMQPAYYIVYVNGKSMGWIDTGMELSAGQSGLYKGAYTFEVEACYQYPEGSSERIRKSVFPGTVPTVDGLKAEAADEGVALTWSAADLSDAPDAVLAGYSVFRDDNLLAEGVTDTEFTDSEVTAGEHIYAVHAIYADGSISLPVNVTYIADGDLAPMALPYSQEFSNGHLPYGWSSEIVDSYGRVKDMYSWRFDNWFENTVADEAGFSGGFASVDGLAAGMNRLEANLYSPKFQLPSDGKANLNFKKYFFEDKPGPSGAASFVVSIKEADAEQWSELAELTSLPNGDVSLSLENYAGKTVSLRWGFLSRNSGFAAIDDVKVSAENVSIEGIIADDARFDIFTLDGRIVTRAASTSELRSLSPGIYLLHATSGKTVKYLAK